VAVAFEEERPLVLDVRERDVRREPHGGREPGVLDVVRRPPEPGLGEAVLVDGLAANARARLSAERPQDADQHLRLERAVVEDEPRREVDELELAGRRPEDGAEDVRVLEVLLMDLGRVDSLDGEDAAALGVQERAEHEARVRARPAHPLDRPVADERVVRAVADEGETSRHE
jgi:hypothetical protein